MVAITAAVMALLVTRIILEWEPPPNGVDQKGGPPQ
jgi:hypothetical protein